MNSLSCHTCSKSSVPFQSDKSKTYFKANKVIEAKYNRQSLGVTDKRWVLGDLVTDQISLTKDKVPGQKPALGIPIVSVF